MIEARQITKTYQSRRVLQQASIAVTPGQCIVLDGDNGSGKTTLLHVLMGLRRPDAGEVAWNNQVLPPSSRRAWRRARQQWGFLPQHPALPPAATVDSLLRFHARLRNADISLAYQWLNRVGLQQAASQRVDHLSGGMRQRLGIALVMFFSPTLIVMDEPASSLDPSWREALAHWLREQTRRGAAVLVTSQWRESWGDHVVDLRCERGRIVPAAAPPFPEAMP